jgi:hypothetical protein
MFLWFHTGDAQSVDESSSPPPRAAYAQRASHLPLLWDNEADVQRAKPVTPSSERRSVTGTLLEAGPNERVWTVMPADPERASGQDVFREGRGGRRIVEIGSGMNYWDGNAWAPSDPSFEIAPEGDAFVAERVQHRTRLAANLNMPEAVTVTMPDGTVLRSTPVAIGLFDAASGASAILAGIRDSVGMLVGDNQVVYPGAFNANGVVADVVYTIEKGTFAQDVIITGRLDPADYGFPTNSVRLQIYTEFYDPPEPERVRHPVRVEHDKRLRERMVSPDLVDEVLGFGEFVITTGRAVPAGTDRMTGEAAAPVAKEFIERGGRMFLLESVEVASIEAELKSLPDLRDGSVGGQAPKDRFETKYARIPAPLTASGMELAANVGVGRRVGAEEYAPTGLAIDYVAPIGGTLSGTRTFQGDTTYFVQDPVYCSGTVYIEGGSVFKFPNSIGGSNPKTTFLRLAGTVINRTSSYAPAIFTAGDDDAIGELIYYDVWNGVTGDTTGKHYANPAIWFFYSSWSTLSNMRFSFCQEAVRAENDFQTSSVTVSHSQFVNCIRGIRLTGSGSGSGSGTAVPLTVNNTLMADVQYPFTVNTPVPGNVVRHVTIDNSVRLITATASASFNFVNSIFANVASLVSGSASLSGSYNGFSPPTAPLFGSSGTRWTAAYPPFETSGLGACYIPADSVFRGKGTTSVGTALLTDLKTRTTQVPVDFPRFMLLTGDLTLFPQGARYVSGSPDLGYWYPVMDYTVGRMRVNGGTIRVMPGTVIGTRQELVMVIPYTLYTHVGFELQEGSTFLSHGLPNRPIIYAATKAVQETTDAAFGLYRVSYDMPDTILFCPEFQPNPQDSPPPVLDFRFSQFHALPTAFHLWSGYGYDWDFEPSAVSRQYWRLRDCTLQGGEILVGLPTWVTRNIVWGDGSIEWTNNTFDRVDVTLDPTWLADGFAMNVDLAFHAQQNLFRGQRVFLNPIPATEGNWLFSDNLFDKVAFEFYGTEPLDHGHNAYWRRVGGELDAGQTDRLTPPSATDVLLTAAPPYLNGPFGGHYLSTSSELYNTGKRGSRTPAEAGLFHYTTRTDQTKDGSQSGNLIIGRHYVAAVNSWTALPRDTDGDGVPDYVEDANGDGLWDEGLETRINAAYTDAGVHDSINVLYDDVDLDGDGLVGLVEKALGKNPLVPDNPLTLSQMFEDEPGIYSFTLPISHDLIEGIGELNLNINGAAATLDETVEGPGGNTVLYWNSTFDPPGQLYLQPQLYVGTSGSPAVGPVLPFYSENVVQFYEAGSMFKQSVAYLDAVLPRPSATYTIVLYDPTTTPPTHIRTIGPHSTFNGRIEQDWNVTFANGTPFTGSIVEATYNVTLHAYGGLPPAQGEGTRLFIRQENALNETGRGKFNFTYMQVSPWSWMASEFSKDGTIWNGMLGVVDALMKPQVTYEVYTSDFNRYNYPYWQDNPGYLNSRAMVTDQLLPTFETTRNFYCYAHGNPSWLIDPSNDVFIKRSEVASRLGNRRRFLRALEIQNPYRFVFLDACDGAKTKRWAQAFGIVPRPRDPARSLSGPQAFVGWSTEVSAYLAGPKRYDDPALRPVYKEVARKYTETLQFFYAQWMLGTPLADCIRWSSSKWVREVPFPVKGNEVITITAGGFVDVGLPVMTGDIYVVGYSGLTVEGHRVEYDGHYKPPYQW